MLYQPLHFLKWFRFPLFLLFLAGGAHGAGPSLQGKLAWEGEYIDRGIRKSGNILHPNFDLFSGQFYAGATAFLEVDDDFEEFNLYGGTYRSLSPLFSLDAGLNLIEVDGVGEVEAYAGLVLEYGLNPAIYVFYRWEAETLSIEAAVSSRLELNPQLFLDWSLTAGGSIPQESDVTSWGFIQGTLDLVYPLNSRLELSLGIRASSRSEDLNLPEASYLWTGVGLQVNL